MTPIFLPIKKWANMGLMPGMLPIYIVCPPNRLPQPGVVESVIAQGHMPQIIDLPLPSSYYCLIRDLWAEEDFMLIEHDNMPVDNLGNPLAISDLFNCPKPFCGLSYPLGINNDCTPRIEMAFGLTVFKNIRYALPNIWDPKEIAIRQHPNGPEYWDGLDQYFKYRADQINVTGHCHGQGTHLKGGGENRLSLLGQSLITRLSS